MRRGIAIVFAAGCSFHDGTLPDDGARAADAARGDGTAPLIDARPIDAPDAATCPPGFALIAGAPTTSRYRIYGWSSSTNQSRNFATAVGTCSAQGAHMAIADSPQEAGALAAAIPVNPASNYFWDGVTDAALETVWITVVASPAAYLPWASMQPNGGAAANCGLLSTGAQLYDWDCNASYPFACECD